MALAFKHGEQIEYYKDVMHRDGTKHRELRKAIFLFQESGFVRVRIQTSKYNHKEVNLPVSELKVGE